MTIESKEKLACMGFTWTLIFCQSTLWAELLKGLKLLLRQPSPGQAEGGTYLPSSNRQLVLQPHLLHSKSICEIWGLTGLILMTVPEMVTRLPMELAFSKRICKADSGWLTMRILTLV